MHVRYAEEFFFYFFFLGVKIFECVNNGQLIMSYSEFRRTSNSVSRSGLHDGKFMVGKIQWFYIATYGENKS